MTKSIKIYTSLDFLFFLFGLITTSNYFFIHFTTYENYDPMPAFDALSLLDIAFCLMGLTLLMIKFKLRFFLLSIVHILDLSKLLISCCYFLYFFQEPVSNNELLLIFAVATWNIIFAGVFLRFHKQQLISGNLGDGIPKA